MALGFSALSLRNATGETGTDGQTEAPTPHFPEAPALVSGPGLSETPTSRAHSVGAGCVPGKRLQRRNAYF